MVKPLNGSMRGRSCLALCLALWPLAGLASAYDKTHTWDLKLNVLAGEDYFVAWQAHTAITVGGTTTRTTQADGLQPAVLAPANGTTLPLNDALGGATASAVASFNARANGKGSHTLKGNAQLGTGTIAASSATSSVALRARARDGKGGMKWKGDWAIDTFKASGRETDPLDFTVTNLDTGAVLRSELFSFVVDLGDTGGASWKNGLVQLSGLQGSMTIVMDSPYITTGVGRIFVQFAGGVVTASEDSGVFDGLLPSVGAASDFSFALGGSDGLDIGFDFGAANTLGYDFDVGIGVEAFVAEVPEPAGAALMALGLAGLAFAARRRQGALRLVR